MNSRNKTVLMLALSGVLALPVLSLTACSNGGSYNSSARVHHGVGYRGYYGHPWRAYDAADVIDTVDTIDIIDSGGAVPMGGYGGGMDMGGFDW